MVQTQIRRYRMWCLFSIYTIRHIPEDKDKYGKELKCPNI